MVTPFKVAALSGSLRKAAFNNGFIEYATTLSGSVDLEGLEIEHVDILSLPLLNNDLTRDGILPPGVKAFRNKILGAHGILFALPKNNNSSSITAPLKNAIDWVSISQNLWDGKRAAIVSAGGISQYELRQIGVSRGLNFIKGAEFFLDELKNPANFNGEGDLINEVAKSEVKKVLLSLMKPSP